MFLYIGQNIRIEQGMIEEVQSLVLKYIWDNKPAKIRKEVMYQEINKGGIKLINVEWMLNALRINWIIRLQNENSINRTIVDGILGDVSFIDICRSRGELNKDILEKLPGFYIDILKSLKKLRELHKPISADDIQYEMLWFNPYILVNNSPLFYKEWYNNGLLYIHQLIDNNGYFVDRYILEEQLEIDICFLEYISICNAIPAEWKKILKETPPIPDLQTNRNIFIKIDDKKLDLKDLRTKKIYKIYQNQQIFTPTCIAKWNEELGADVQKWDTQWDIQFRILHRIIPHGTLLYKMKLITHDICTLCYSEPDTILHRFFECIVIANLWREVENWWNDITINETDLRLYDCIYGLLNQNDERLNFIILLVKYHIHKM